MQLARFRTGRRVRYGILEGESVREVEGSIFGRFRTTGVTHALRDVRLLAPCNPGKVLAAAVNYRSHANEEWKAPPCPQLFFKAPSCIIGTDDAIVIPPDAEQTDFEGELVAVIGRRARNVSTADALSYVLGYTCGNDVSERVWQRSDTQWWRAKSSDTFGTLGPVITTGLDPANLELELRQNGTVMQRTNTGELIYGVAELISFASRYVTLEPGDVLYTGTPGTTAPMRAGDVIDVEIGGIGVLRNPVK